MNGKPDDRRVRRTKSSLRRGLALLMAEKNVKDITVRELTDLVDIHRGTFYLHYKDIYELLEKIENEIIAEVTQLCDTFKPMRHGDSPQPVLTAIMEYIIENKELCQALLGNNANRSFIDKLRDILQSQLFHMMLQRFQVLGSERELEYFIRYLISGYIAVITKWVEDGMEDSPQAMAELMSRFGMYGIGFLDRSADVVPLNSVDSGA